MHDIHTQTVHVSIISIDSQDRLLKIAETKEIPSDDVYEPSEDEPITETPVVNETND